MEKLAFVVDDDPVYQEFVKGHMKHLGYRIISFLKGEECIQQLTRENPCVIILDQQLRNENGLDILRKIKSVKPRIPVIFLSAQPDGTSAVQAVKYGAFDYIEKNGAAFVKLRTALDKLNSIKKQTFLQRIANLFSSGE